MKNQVANLIVFVVVQSAWTVLIWFLAQSIEIESQEVENQNLKWEIEECHERLLKANGEIEILTKIMPNE
tara:strand:+ start:369 stop:578 length:210 start_codon:yes stop_codon:yes gene_type:complete